MTGFRHLNSAEDLVTTRAEVRAGFIAIALEKNRRAIPFVEEGRALRVAATVANTPSDLLQIPSIRPALLTASGLSDKAIGHLREQDKTSAISGLIEEFLEPAGADFVDELVYRFLLIRGDSLGGKMRNIAGFLAEKAFKRALLSALSIRGQDFYWQSKQFKRWSMYENPIDDVGDVVGISWSNPQTRTLVFNKTIGFIGNNVDICLLSALHDSVSVALKEPSRYILLGEIKGGIDPAGADEHWKTARTAIQRILAGFRDRQVPIKTLFIGAAIERAMADEIWSWLQSGDLNSAGNLTNAVHVASICNWLVEV